VNEAQSHGHVLEVGERERFTAEDPAQKRQAGLWVVPVAHPDRRSFRQTARQFRPDVGAKNRDHHPYLTVGDLERSLTVLRGDGRRTHHVQDRVRGDHVLSDRRLPVLEPVEVLTFARRECQGGQQVGQLTDERLVRGGVDDVGVASLDVHRAVTLLHRRSPWAGRHRRVSSICSRTARPRGPRPRRV
jgi:hypothetical protein